MSDAFVARFSPWRRMAALALCLGFVALGLWEAGAVGGLGASASPWIGYGGAAVFATFFLLGLFKSRWRGEAIRVDAAGIRLWRARDALTIPWSAVLAIEEQSSHGQRFVCLWLDDPARHGAQGWMSDANRGLGFGDVAFGVQATDRRFADLCAAVARFAPPQSG